MDRKARIVRFWLLVLAMLGAVVLCPELAVGLWPVAFFFPGCLCCGTCTACSPDYTNDFEVVVAGMVDKDCDECSELDATYVTTFGGMSGIDYCYWRYETTFLFGSCTDYHCAYYNIRVEVRKINGSGLQVFIFFYDTASGFSGPAGSSRFANVVEALDCSAYSARSCAGNLNTGGNFNATCGFNIFTPVTAACDCLSATAEVTAT